MKIRISSVIIGFFYIGQSMDRRLLQFLAVAETGNVTSAAQKLHVSQPTISVNIQKLEEQHCVALFERSSRGVVLTEFGAILYEHVRIMARLEEHAATKIQELKTSSRETLKIGCGFAWWSAFVQTVISDYRSDNPGVSVLVDVASSLDGLRNLLSGDISLFIGTRVDHLSRSIGLEFDELFAMKDGSFVREGHPLAGMAVSPRKLAAFDTLDVVPFESSHLGIIERGSNSDLGLSNPSSERATLSSNSMTVCLDLLRTSDAILTYPIIVKEFFKNHGVVMLDVKTSRPGIPIGIYSLSERSQDTTLAELKRRIVARAAHCMNS